MSDEQNNKTKVILARPPKDIADMTDDELRDWCNSMADGLNPDT
jgi:hypothetical protein